MPRQLNHLLSSIQWNCKKRNCPLTGDRWENIYTTRINKFQCMGYVWKWWTDFIHLPYIKRWTQLLNSSWNSLPYMKPLQTFSDHLNMYIDETFLYKNSNYFNHFLHRKTRGKFLNHLNKPLFGARILIQVLRRPWNTLTSIGNVSSRKRRCAYQFISI